MTIINLTPHAINFVDSEGKEIKTIEPSGNLARVDAKTVATGEVFCGIPVTSTEYGIVEGLPDQTDDTIYVVSSIAAQRCKDRPDVFIPSESIRDDKGRIIGCRSLGRV